MSEVRDKDVTWFFGQYIERLLQKKSWKLPRLEKESGISYAYLSYLVKGQDPGTGKAPSPTVDKILALAKALSVKPTDLIYAYQGIDPDALKEKEEAQNTDQLKGLVKSFLQEAMFLVDVPDKTLFHALENRFQTPEARRKFALKVLNAEENG